MREEDFLMDFASLAGDLGAALHSFSGEKGFASVSVDSRKVQKGSLFVALEGEAADGHFYIEEAFKAGAAGVMARASSLRQFAVLETAEKYGGSVIAADDTLFGLQEAARLYLQKFPRLLKIGITGSAGKTTTKEIAAAVIRQEKNTVMSAGNLNSETGLPLSVFNVRAEHEAGVFELAMNRKGEIAALARVLRPNIALITNIGLAHVGLLGSQDAIAAEKKEIFSCLGEGDAALIPKEDGYRDFLARGVSGKTVFYGPGGFEEFEGAKDLGLSGWEVSWAGEKIKFALPGPHGLADMFAALAVARQAGVSGAAVKRGLESARPMFGRMEILEGRATVIRDCYNASPESVASALDFADNIEWAGRRVYIMADMRELGAGSKRIHENLGDLLLKSKADEIFLFGKETVFTAQALASSGRAFFHTGDFAELSAKVGGALEKGDLVLLKGARGCALERLDGIILGDISNGA